MRHHCIRSVASILVLITSPVGAWAEDDSAQDKSGFTFFNPTPENQMRGFCTDRPTKSTAACTVDAGHFQLETDLFNWTRSSIGGTTQNIFLYTNPTLKLGLTDRIDLQLNMAPLVQVKTTNNATGTKTDIKGVGDLFAKLKYNIAGNEGGDLGVAVMPYVKFPTARLGIGNHSYEGGIIMPISYALPMDLTLVVDPEIDIFRNASNSGYHANFQGLVNISRPIRENVVAAVEIWTDVNKDPAGTTRQWSFDTSLSWVIRPNLQLDIGANVGLNRATPDLQAYIGISKRF